MQCKGTYLHTNNSYQQPGYCQAGKLYKGDNSSYLYVLVIVVFDGIIGDDDNYGDDTEQTCIPSKIRGVKGDQSWYQRKKLRNHFILYKTVYESFQGH